MPFVSRQGSLPHLSSREQPNTLLPETQNNHPVLDNTALLQERVIEKTFLNNSSFNEDNFRYDRTAVAGFPEGRIVIVTYYSQVSPVTDIQSKTVDMRMQTKDDVHLEWAEIRNFELRCQSDISFEYSEDSNVSELNSEAITLPGFEPKINDIFLYGLRNDKIGIFEVTNVQRLALGQDTYHRITFTMQEWLTPSKRDQLHRQSTVWYFDKTKFMMGNNAMLSTEGFIDQKELAHLRLEIIQNYVDRFYSNEFSSFMRPDGIYDPYVVEYWNKKVSYRDSYQRPVQIFIAVANYKKTIWAILTNNPIKDLRNVARKEEIYTYANTFWGVNITSLIGDRFLVLGDDEGSEDNPMIDSFGNPILVDATPRFHTNEHQEALKKLEDKHFDDLRRMFYGDFLPFRKCAPHQHPLDIPDACDPEICKECDQTCQGHLPTPPLLPPYPVVTVHDLLEIWSKMQHTEIDLNDVTTMARFKGYVDWYRKTYPGTLSAFDLELEWRKEAGKEEREPLTPEEQTALAAYIASYRAQYLPVLTDRKIEIVWRIKTNTPLSILLDAEQGAKLRHAIQCYRDAHGQVPSDQIVTEEQIIGMPVTTEEIDALGGEPREMDLPDGPTGGVPMVYWPKHPKPNHHLHCHSVCHNECGVNSKKADAEEDYSNLSSCGLSAAFFNGSASMSPAERILYDVITNKKIDVKAILGLVQDYLSAPNDVTFYWHLYSLYLIDKALYWLRFHS